MLLYGSEAVATDAELYQLEVTLSPLGQLNTALVKYQMMEQILNDEKGSRASGLAVAPAPERMEATESKGLQRQRANMIAMASLRVL